MKRWKASCVASTTSSSRSCEADGTERSFRREGDRPKVEVRDPLQGHSDLLAVCTDKNMHDVTAYLVTLK